MRGFHHLGFKRLSRSPGGGGAASGLPVDAIVVFLDNSYGQRNTQNDTTSWTVAHMGGVGYRPLGFRHARAGDKLKDFRARIPQILAMNPKCVLVGNPQNSLGDGLATMQADYQNIVADLTAPGSTVTNITFANQPVTASNNEASVSPINDWLASWAPTVTAAKVNIADDHAAAQILGADGDGTSHPSAAGAIKLGKSRATALLQHFAVKSVAADLSIALAGNLNTEFNMPDTNADGLSNGWALTNAYTGATVVTEMGTFRTKPGIPCQVLRVSGTSAVDPTVTGNELRLLKTIALATATKLTGLSARMTLYVEISNAAGNAGPVNLASFHISAGVGVAWSKAYATTNGPSNFDAPFAGFASSLPAVITAQNINQQLIVSARPIANVAADYEIRFGFVNLLLDEQVAYAPPYDQSIILYDTGSQNQPVFSTGAPLITGTPGVGNPVTYSRCGLVTGGGMVDTYGTMYGGGTAWPVNAFIVRSPYVLPGDVAGNIEGARPSATAQVQYTQQAADQGTSLKMGVQWKNALGEIITYSAAIGPVP